MNILPSYHCNFNCPFCVFRNNNSKELLDLDWFKKEIDNIKDLNYLNIVGGEPTILDKNYLTRLIKICYNRTNKKPSLYTNLFNVSPMLPLIDLNVSFNPGITEQAEVVKNNIMSLEQDFKLNMILTNKLKIQDIKFFLRLKRLTKLSISKYTHLVGPDYTIQEDRAEKFIDELLNIKDERLHFYPMDSLKQNYKRDNSCAACAEVLPNNKYRISVRDFFHTKRNVFKEYDSYEEVEKAFNSALEEEIPERCNNCKFKYNCWRIFNNETDCKIIKTIKRRTNT